MPLFRTGVTLAKFLYFPRNSKKNRRNCYQCKSEDLKSDQKAGICVTLKSVCLDYYLRTIPKSAYHFTLLDTHVSEPIRCFYTFLSNREWSSQICEDTCSGLVYCQIIVSNIAGDIFLYFYRHTESSSDTLLILIYSTAQWNPFVSIILNIFSFLLLFFFRTLSCHVWFLFSQVLNFTLY